MGVGGAIREPSGPLSLPWLVRAVIATGAAITAAVVALVALSVRAAPAGRTATSWLAHHHECHKLPEELYHRDRFRAIRGHVTDEDGKPVAGAVVRCVRLESLVALAKAGAPSPVSWSIPIEAETKTDEEGRYEFARLPVGGRTFFYSAPGRDLAPAVKDLVVVQDGLGAQLDVTLARPSALRVKVAAGRAPSLLVKGAGRSIPRSARGESPARLHLIPHRWWPDLITAAIAEGRDSVEFQGLGGPLRKGLIAASGADRHAPLWVVGRYDLDESGESVSSCVAEPARSPDGLFCGAARREPCAAPPPRCRLMKRPLSLSACRLRREERQSQERQSQATLGRCLFYAPVRKTAPSSSANAACWRPLKGFASPKKKCGL